MSHTPEQPPFDLLIQESGYPCEAFEFVQEGLAFAVQHVHGKMSKLEKRLYKQMAEKNIDYSFLCEAYSCNMLDDELTELVDQLGGPEKINRHVSGQQLCHGLRELALRKWGMMASSVLRKWHITETLDFGKIVFFLVEHNQLQKQPEDSVEDFANVFDFRTAFQPRFSLQDDQTR